MSSGFDIFSIVAATLVVSFNNFPQNTVVRLLTLDNNATSDALSTS